MNNRALRRIIVVTVPILMALSIESAVARSFCSNINLLIDAAPGNFAGFTAEPGEGSGARDVMPKLEGSSDCTVRPLIKGKSYFCTWAFQHRDAGAYAKFAALSQELQSCIGDRAMLSDDQSVNHPDFYEARMFSLDKVKVVVSVKDKSALGSTFIFVFVEPKVGT